jgi:broad specificity phosphatase PhoE
MDPELDDAGVEQAQAAGRAVAATARPTRIITSPLARTRATAHAIADAVEAAHGARVPVEVDERWIELDYGELDGRPLGEIPAELWAQWRADPAFAPPGGESLVDLGRRVRRAMEGLADDELRGGDLGGPGTAEDVVVVSHVSPIKAAVAWALDVGDEVTWRLFLAPASITRIALRPTGPSLHGFNDIGHLA